MCTDISRRANVLQKGLVGLAKNGFAARLPPQPCHDLNQVVKVRLAGRFKFLANMEDDFSLSHNLTHDFFQPARCNEKPRLVESGGEQVLRKSEIAFELLRQFQVFKEKAFVIILDPLIAIKEMIDCSRELPEFMHNAGSGSVPIPMLQEVVRLQKRVGCSAFCQPLVE